MTSSRLRLKNSLLIEVKLLNMLPASSKNDCTNGSCGATILSTECVSTVYSTPFDVNFTNFPYYLGCQFRPRDVIAPSVALLAYAVPHVIGLSSKEQVVWINAVRHVAFMQNEQSMRNLSVMQNPRKTMGVDRLAIYEKVAVSILIAFFASPEPARTKVVYGRTVLIDLFPESRSGVVRSNVWGSDKPPSRVMKTAQVSHSRRTHASDNYTFRQHRNTPSVVPRKSGGKSVGFRRFGCTALAAQAL